MRCVFGFVITLGLLGAGQASAAVTPGQVAVIYNKNLEISKSLAEYYAGKRQVPAENLIGLDVGEAEEIPRSEYESRIMVPLRAALKERRGAITVLLTMYGMPLRVGAAQPSEQEKVEIAKLTPQLRDAEAQKQKLIHAVRILKSEVEKDPKSPLADSIPEREAQLKTAEQQVAELEQKIRLLNQVDSVASVDSELMLLWWPPYPLARWVINPLHWQFPESQRQGVPPVLMTARLDAPHPKIVRRMIDDALEAEAKGLEGKVYIDARGIKYVPETDPSGTGYGGYDQSFREAARILEKQAGMAVFLDDQEALMPAGSGVDCALYAGWYALRNYQPCCKFVPGAVAWHLASLEATSLRNPGREWAGNLLLDGAAVTLGPVAEPFTVAFPKPAEFFGFLVSGEFTLVECYARTHLLTSWVMVLLGDPLYQPFKKKPRIKSWEVLSSPFGAQIFK